MNKEQKSKTIYILLIFFLFISFVYISPSYNRSNSDLRSSQLIKKTTITDNIERTDFMNAQGEITIAAELGYATKTITHIGQSSIERYYNDQGKPISRYSGYYALLKVFDDAGNNIRITYLDIDNKPFVSKYGYATEERQYNESGQIASTKYYDAEGNPVLSELYGYGKINIYDGNGYNTKTTYINIDGEPMITKQGYSSVVRKFYNAEGPQKGNVESELYYDEHGKPMALSLGEFGIHKEYDENGRISVLTYLDADENPIITNKGYTTISRTFHADDSVATERYFDREGNPISLSENQYGIKKENGLIIYLDEYGKEVFNFRNTLYNYSWIVIPLVLFFNILSTVINKRWNIIFLFFYLFIIVYFTLLFRENVSIKDTVFFSHYRQIFTNSIVRADIIKNIWLFIPLGIILYQLYPHKTILIIPLLLSIIIEEIQHFSGIGYRELDDILSNSLGGYIGFLSGKLTTELIKRIKSRKHIHIV